MKMKDKITEGEALLITINLYRELQEENEKLKDALAFYACMKHVTGIQISPNPDCSGAYVCIEDYSGKLADETLNEINGSKYSDKGMK